MERFAIVDHGCKVNRYDGERVRAALLRYGLEPCDDPARSDLLVLNACAVTDKAVRRGRQQLRAFRRNNSGARILVTGCFTADDRSRYAVIADDGVKLVDARERDHLDDMLRDWLPAAVVARRKDDDPFTAAFDDRARAYLKVEDGCDARCAFCVIPRIRGPVRSKPLTSAVAEARALLERGFAELVVCGIHLGHYGRDTGEDLLALLDALCALPFEFRLRLGSLEVTELDEALISRIARDPRIAPHLHVPLQSGDDGVLRAMRRPYTADGFRRRLAALAAAAPGVAFTTDVIVGFPGEDAEAFARSCDLVARLSCSKVHVFPFSPRAGTEAASLPGRVGPSTLRARVRRLLELDDTLRRVDDRRSLGTTERVLIHETLAIEEATYSRGLSGRHRQVFVAGEFPVGCLVAARITDVAPFRADALLAEPIGEPDVEGLR